MTQPSLFSNLTVSVSAEQLEQMVARLDRLPTYTLSFALIKNKRGHTDYTAMLVINDRDGKPKAEIISADTIPAMMGQVVDKIDALNLKPL